MYLNTTCISLIQVANGGHLSLILASVLFTCSSMYLNTTCISLIQVANGGHLSLILASVLFTCSSMYLNTTCISLIQVANDFSNYQLNKLMKRSKLNRQLEDVRKTLKSNETSVRVLGGEGGGKSLSCEVESNRIMSSDSAHYILVKGVDLKTGSSQDELHEEEKDESGAKKERNDHDVMLDRNDVVVNTKDDRLGTRFRKELGSSLESSVPQNESKNERLISESTSNNEAFTNETSMRSRESEVNVYKDEPQLPHTVCTTTSPNHNTLDCTKAVLSLEPVSGSSQGISSFSDVMVYEGGSDLIPAGTIITTTTDSQQHSTAIQGSKHSTTVPDSGHVELQTNDDSDLPSLTCTSVGNERQLELKTDAIEGSGIGVNGEHGGTGETDRFGDGDGGRESGKVDMIVKVGESSDSGAVWESGGGGFEIGGEVGDGSGTPDIGEGGEADDGSCVGDGGEVGDMRDGGEVSEVGVVGDGDKVGDDGEVSEVGDGGEISEVGDGDKVGDDGEVSEVGDGHKVGDDGEVSEVGSEVGDGGEVGDNGGEWEEYVLQMSPSTAQFHLRQEVGELSRETQRQKRAAASLNSQVYREAQVYTHVYMYICAQILINDRLSNLLEPSLYNFLIFVAFGVYVSVYWSILCVCIFMSMCVCVHVCSVFCTL